MVRALLAVCLSLAAGGAVAAEPSQCVRLIDRATGGVDIANGCNQKLNVSYCVDNPKSSFACAKRSGFGMKTLSPGGKEFIPFYASDGRGRVLWAACVYPAAAFGWDGTMGDRYTCR